MDIANILTYIIDLILLIKYWRSMRCICMTCVYYISLVCILFGFWGPYFFWFIFLVYSVHKFAFRIYNYYLVRNKLCFPILTNTRFQSRAFTLSNFQCTSLFYILTYLDGCNFFDDKLQCNYANAWQKYSKAYRIADLSIFHYLAVNIKMVLHIRCYQIWRAGNQRLVATSFVFVFFLFSRFS